MKDIRTPSSTTRQTHDWRGKRSVQRGRKRASRAPTGSESLLLVVGVAGLGGRSVVTRLLPATATALVPVLVPVLVA